MEFGIDCLGIAPEKSSSCGAVSSGTTSGAPPERRGRWVLFPRCKYFTAARNQHIKNAGYSGSQVSEMAYVVTRTPDTINFQSNITADKPFCRNRNKEVEIDHSIREHQTECDEHAEYRARSSEHWPLLCAEQTRKNKVRGRATQAAKSIICQKLLGAPGILDLD